MQDLPDSLFFLWSLFEHIFSQDIESRYKEKSEFEDFMFSCSKILCTSHYSVINNPTMNLQNNVEANFSHESFSSFLSNISTCFLKSSTILSNSLGDLSVV